MKNKITAALAVALCATAFAVPAFAGGGEGEPYYTETAGTEADPAEDAEAPEVTITDEEDPAGDDSADNNTEADGDTLDQITELLGGLGTVTVTEDGILFTPDTEKWETQQTGTVTTCGGNLNVRTGAGLDNDAFTQLPDGAQVEVIGTEGEWVKVLLPEREGYVHSDYLTITDTGSFSLSLDGTDLSALLELFASGLSGGGGAALTPDGNLSLIDDLRDILRQAVHHGGDKGRQRVLSHHRPGRRGGADRPLPEPGGRGGPSCPDGGWRGPGGAGGLHLYGEMPGRGGEHFLRGVRGEYGRVRRRGAGS